MSLDTAWRIRFNLISSTRNLDQHYFVGIPCFDTVGLKRTEALLFIKWTVFSRKNSQDTFSAKKDELKSSECNFISCGNFIPLSPIIDKHLHNFSSLKPSAWSYKIAKDKMTWYILYHDIKYMGNTEENIHVDIGVLRVMIIMKVKLLHERVNKTFTCLNNKPFLS